MEDPKLWLTKRKRLKDKSEREIECLIEWLKDCHSSWRIFVHTLRKIGSLIVDFPWLYVQWGRLGCWMLVSYDCTYIEKDRLADCWFPMIVRTMSELQRFVSWLLVSYDCTTYVQWQRLVGWLLVSHDCTYNEWMTKIC